MEEVEWKRSHDEEKAGPAWRVGCRQASEVMSSVTLVNYAKRSSFGTRRIPHRAFVYIMKPRVRDQKSKRQVPGVQSDTADAAVSKWHSFGRSRVFFEKIWCPRRPKGAQVWGQECGPAKKWEKPDPKVFSAAQVCVQNRYYPLCVFWALICS